MNRILAILFLIAACLPAHAGRIDFADISIDLPDEASVQYDSTQTMVRARIADATLYLTTLGDPSISRKVDFDENRVLADMHKELLNFDRLKPVDEQSNHDSFNFRASYARRIYADATRPERKAMSYTFYTPSRPYCIVVTYTGDELPEPFAAAIGSVRDDLSPLAWQWNVFRNTWAIAIFFFVGAMLLAQMAGWAMNRERRAMAAAIICGIAGFFLAFTIGAGAWVLAILLCVAAAAGGYCGMILKFEDFLDSAVNG